VTSTPSGPVCGNSVKETGEDCDPPGQATCPNAGNGLEICSVNCKCACPTKVHFAGDANDPASILDTGWTGIAHRAPVIANSDVTIALSCVATSRPCGTCTVSGPIANAHAGAGELNDQRCTNDTAVKCASNGQCNVKHCIGGTNEGTACTVDTQCPGGVCSDVGTCQFFFGSNLPLAAGGVTTCVVNQFNGSLSGTANVETGEASTSVTLTSRVFNGLAIDNPCPRCIGDGTPNDGANGGTCDGGPRVGKSCDSNGSVPGRPDFGSTSLDCPPSAGALIATLPIDLSNATDPVVKTVSASSPGCSGEPGERCLCDTCNNANQEPCDANADCPDPAGTIGPICAGRRCIGGTNNGAACNGALQCIAGTNFGATCTTATQCPGSSCAALCSGGGICGRPGEPTKPTACLDDTATVGVLDCSDSAPVDGEGECTAGPITTSCSVASGHAQRGCTLDSECGGTAGSCESHNRTCFLTGGFSGKNGTNTLIANGMEDPPMNDVSHPTLGAVFCIAPTGLSSVNNVAGLPGPGRVTIKGTASALP
jgi:hypothetical protein